MAPNPNNTNIAVRNHSPNLQSLVLAPSGVRDMDLQGDFLRRLERMPYEAKVQPSQPMLHEHVQTQQPSTFMDGEGYVGF